MPHTTTTNHNPEHAPRSPIEAMMQSRFREPVIGLELLKRIMPAEAPLLPMSEEVRQHQERVEMTSSVPMNEDVKQHQEQVESLIRDRNKSESELRFEQIRAQVNQEARPGEYQQTSLTDV